jgi:response regulator of citrate/malate metabolism
MRHLVSETVSGIRGFTVSGLARNVWEARLEVHRRRPDLVLLDEILPGESSLDLLAELIEQGIGVWLLTGASEGARQVPQGVYGRLAKPTWETLETDRVRFEKALQRTR